VSGFLSGRGQRALLELNRSIASGERRSEVTEDQGLRISDYRGRIGGILLSGQRYRVRTPGHFSARCRGSGNVRERIELERNFC
jgi:hypothetical protein